MRYKEEIKQLVAEDSKILRFILWIYNYLPFNNQIKLRGNSLKVGTSYLKKTRIDVTGKNNTIIIHNGCRLRGCRFYIRGNNNLIELSDFTFADTAEFYIEDDANRIFCGKHNSFTGKIQLACTEGKEILTGEDCLFSSEIVLRTGDSHSIINDQGQRINPAKSIMIGDHVWIGHRVLVNKGVKIARNSIVGTGSVLTHAFNDEGICIAGVPARKVREDISWLAERI